MKHFPAFRFIVLATLLLFLPKTRGVTFALATTQSASNVSINSTITYSIFLTNTSGVLLSNAKVLSVFPTTAQLVDATNAVSNTVLAGGNVISTNAGQVLFAIDLFPVDGFAHITLTLRPTVTGSFTNTITAATSTEIAATNILIATISGPQADLGVTVTGLPSAVLINDLIHYFITVTNLGPSTAAGLIVASDIPENATNITVLPAGQAFSVARNQILIPLSNLTNATATTLTVGLQPTSTNHFSLATTISTTSSVDTTTGNNTTTKIFDVVPTRTGNLVINATSAQAFNPQTGLVEQTVTLKNVGAASIATARVAVTNLVAPHRLYNATGTNGSDPYVALSVPLAAGASADVLLQYFIPTRLPDSALGLVAVEAPSANFTLPNGPSIALSDTNIVTAPSGAIVLDFPTTVGRSYTIISGDDAGLTNAVPLQAPITARNIHIQFVDTRPQAPARFYSVIENP